MKLSSWMRRIGNVRKKVNSEKSMEHQLMRVVEETTEMFLEIRSGADLRKITYKKDERGIEKPHGFPAEWGDTVAQLLHIADLVGFDPEEAMHAVTKYHEHKQAKKQPPKKGKKGKSK